MKLKYVIAMGLRTIFFCIVIIMLSLLAYGIFLTCPNLLYIIIVAIATAKLVIWTCDTLRELKTIKFCKKLEKSINDVKENKTEKFIGVDLRKMRKEREEYKENHPIKYKFKEFYYTIRRHVLDVQFYSSIIKNYFERGKQGWGHRDVWGLDSYLGQIISETLQHLKDNKMGYPSDLTEKQWDKYLDNMIYTFNTAIKISNGEVTYIPSKEFTEKKYKKYHKWVIETNKETDLDYKILTKKQSLKFEKGWDLFRKYYFSLWD